MTFHLLLRCLGAFLLAALLANAAVATAAALPPGLSGAWHNPDQRGHGLAITVHSAQSALVFWYAGDPLGNPLTLYSEAQFDGVRHLRGDVLDSRGIRFGLFDPASHRLTRWGDLEIELLGCDRLLLRYDANGPGGGPAYGRGEIEMHKLAGVRDAACASGAKAAGVFTGTLQVPGHAPEPVQALFSAGGAVYLSIDRGLQTPGALLIDDGGAFGGLPLDLSLAGYRQPTSYRVPNLAAYDLPANETVALSARLEADQGGYRAVIASTSSGLPAASVSLQPIDGGQSGLATGTDVPLSAWEGSYFRYEGFVNGTRRSLLVAADGSFEGNDNHDWSPVCRYRGRVTKRLSPGVEFEVALTLEDCGERNGAYAGKAWIAAHEADGKAASIRIATVRTSAGPRLAFQVAVPREP
jgi:hypothetical protein